jgi:hypothetical protein
MTTDGGFPREVENQHANWAAQNLKEMWFGGGQGSSVCSLESKYFPSAFKSTDQLENQGSRCTMT